MKGVVHSEDHLLRLPDVLAFLPCWSSCYTYRVVGSADALCSKHAGVNVEPFLFVLVGCIMPWTGFLAQQAA